MIRQPTPFIGLQYSYMKPNNIAQKDDANSIQGQQYPYQANPTNPLQSSLTSSQQTQLELNSRTQDLSQITNKTQILTQNKVSRSSSSSSSESKQSSSQSSSSKSSQSDSSNSSQQNSEQNSNSSSSQKRSNSNSSRSSDSVENSPPKQTIPQIRAAPQSISPSSSSSSSSSASSSEKEAAKTQKFNQTQKVQFQQASVSDQKGKQSKEQEKPQLKKDDNKNAKKEQYKSAERLKEILFQIRNIQRELDSLDATIARKFPFIKELLLKQQARELQELERVQRELNDNEGKNGKRERSKSKNKSRKSQSKSKEIQQNLVNDSLEEKQINEPQSQRNTNLDDSLEQYEKKDIPQDRDNQKPPSHPSSKKNSLHNLSGQMQSMAKQSQQRGNNESKGYVNHLENQQRQKNSIHQIIANDIPLSNSFRKQTESGQELKQQQDLNNMNNKYNSIKKRGSKGDFFQKDEDNVFPNQDLNPTITKSYQNNQPPQTVYDLYKKNNFLQPPKYPMGVINNTNINQFLNSGTDASQGNNKRLIDADNNRPNYGSYYQTFGSRGNSPNTKNSTVPGIFTTNSGDNVTTDPKYQKLEDLQNKFSRKY